MALTIKSNRGRKKTSIDKYKMKTEKDMYNRSRHANNAASVKYRHKKSYELDENANKLAEKLSKFKNLYEEFEKNEKLIKKLKREP